jgi:hypothetical protein
VVASYVHKSALESKQWQGLCSLWSMGKDKTTGLCHVYMVGASKFTYSVLWELHAEKLKIWAESLKPLGSLRKQIQYTFIIQDTWNSPKRECLLNVRSETGSNKNTVLA